MKTTYKDMPNLLVNRVEFAGNSVTAMYGVNGYSVYSYSTLIYDDSGYFNNESYSSTTSTIQNMLIDIFELNNGNKRRGVTK